MLNTLSENQQKWHWLYKDQKFMFSEECIPFGIIRYTHSANDYLPLHNHGFVELVYVISGSATHVFMTKDKKEYCSIVKTGDIFIINPNEEHTFLFNQSSALEILNINFYPSFLEAKYVMDRNEARTMDFVYQQPYLPVWLRFGSILSLDENEQNNFLNQISELTREISERRIGYQLIISLVMGQIFAHLSRKYVEAIKGDNVARGFGENNSNIMRVKGYIEHHYYEDISKEQLAKIGMCSVRQLSRKFKELTGETVVEHIHRLRIKSAKNLLTSTDKKITDIALEVGFNDISFFNKLFKKTVSITPRDYREQHKLEDIDKED